MWEVESNRVLSLVPIRHIPKGCDEDVQAAHPQHDYPQHGREPVRFCHALLHRQYHSNTFESRNREAKEEREVNPIDRLDCLLRLSVVLAQGRDRGADDDQQPEDDDEICYQAGAVQALDSPQQNQGNHASSKDERENTLRDLHTRADSCHHPLQVGCDKDDVPYTEADLRHHHEQVHHSASPRPQGLTPDGSERSYPRYFFPTPQQHPHAEVRKNPYCYQANCPSHIPCPLERVG
mmetsp:Transcript_37486/g.73746  ORF Transcript_37486/g.73746 Transcript_37486/m.73746 type:complete len:236 (+) Transcript_37486:548-1255(+)